MPFSGGLPDPGIEPVSLMSPALVPPGKLLSCLMHVYYCSLPLLFAELALSCHFPLYLDVTSSEKPSLTTAQKSHAFVLHYI